MREEFLSSHRSASAHSICSASFKSSSHFSLAPALHHASKKLSVSSALVMSITTSFTGKWIATSFTFLSS